MVPGRQTSSGSAGQCSRPSKHPSLRFTARGGHARFGRRRLTEDRERATWAGIRGIHARGLLAR